MRSSHSLLSLCLALATAAACSAGATSQGDGAGAASAGGDAGSGGEGAQAGAAGAAGEGTDPTGKSLRLEPADAVVSPIPDQATVVAYRAFYKEPGGAEQEVTAEATWAAEDVTLGYFIQSTFNGSPGKVGKTKVTATANGVSASTTLTIANKTVVIGPGAPPDAEGKFGGEDDPAAKPQLVYPPDGVLVPPNMNSLEIHFIPAPGQTLFEIAFQAPTVVLSVYVGCQPLGGGCVYTPDKTFWATLADEARGTAPVSYTVRGVGADGKTGTSAPQGIQFANEDIVGGLYYWNSAGAIMRYDFGYPGQKPENFLNQFNAGALTCVGCHTLSRDGTRIAVGLDIPSPAPYKVFDVATRKLIYAQGSTFDGMGANFFSFSPDNSQIMTSNGSSINLRDAATGAMLIQNLVPKGTMPDWSPDGKLLVLASPSVNSPVPGLANPGIDSGSIGLLSFDGTSWGGAKYLVPFAGQNNYYPSFSPDNEWVVFNRSPSNRNSFDNGSADSAPPDGEVWAVAVSGGEPLKLERASAAGGGDQWPKWSPNVLTYAGGNVMWLTFSSRRGYGLRSSGGQAQLWMTAFDPQKAKAGQDGSFPSFWMPFQDIASGNHIAQWVTQIVRKPCKQIADCDQGESCDGSSCFPDIK
jgi:hypothetical protein